VESRRARAPVIACRMKAPHEKCLARTKGHPRAAQEGQSAYQHQCKGGRPPCFRPFAAPCGGVIGEKRFEMALRGHDLHLWWGLGRLRSSRSVARAAAMALPAL
jgi:hypothetical protein